MKLKTLLLLLFVSTSISSFAVNDSLCSCLKYYYLDKEDSVNTPILAEAINEKLYLRYSAFELLGNRTLYDSLIIEELETLQRECTKIGYTFNESNNDEQESIWDNPAFIKIFGIIFVIILSGIIKVIITNKKKKTGDKLQKLLNLAGKVPIDKIEDKLVDTFEVSSYEGFWQNFSKGGDEYQMRLSIFNTNLSLNTNEKSAKIHFKDITFINYSTHSRGRYGAVIDTYLELYFDDENLVFSTLAENMSANDKTMLSNQLAKVRINKSNAKLLGQRSGIEFKTVLEITLKKLVDGTKED
ncbi:hypothetical protein OAI90_09895 [Crocinitomicaceae bacterium]|nr:hypothetical protein [Crocinitomicaceae bacterium]